MNRKELLQAAVTTWGIEAQVMMAIEEMAELTQALSKAYRGKDGAVYNLLEEVADVRIMLDQIVLIFEPLANAKATFDTRLAEEAKLTRLAFRLGTTYEPREAVEEVECTCGSEDDDGCFVHGCEVCGKQNCRSDHS